MSTNERTILSVAFAVLTLVCLGVWVLTQRTSADDASVTQATIPVQQSRGNTQVTAKATASAKASASGSARQEGQGGCTADASSSAQARAGNAYDHKEDHDRKAASDGGCSASSSSSAKASSQ